MTQTLANRMTTDTDQVFVACNPLQPQEAMLESSLMAETYGGGSKGVAKTIGKWVGFAILVGIEVYETISEALSDDESDDCCCCCCCDD